MNEGYLYILQNPSLSETHLKIGRTTRDPEARAAEISGSTGVPTPFEVVWSGETVDCVLAEEIVHHHLDDYRTSSAREFFDIELAHAIHTAERAIARTGRIRFFRPASAPDPGDWNLDGAMQYSSVRPVLSFLFHRIVRPILRLPVELILLVGYLTWLFVRWSALACWIVVKLALTLAGALLAGILSLLGLRSRR